MSASLECVILHWPVRDLSLATAFQASLASQVRAFFLGNYSVWPTQVQLTHQLTAARMPACFNLTCRSGLTSAS
jgi:hypothetical protein